jgi:hypothetical protein
MYCMYCVQVSLHGARQNPVYKGPLVNSMRMLVYRERPPWSHVVSRVIMLFRTLVVGALYQLEREVPLLKGIMSKLVCVRAYILTSPRHQSSQQVADRHDENLRQTTCRQPTATPPWRLTTLLMDPPTKSRPTILPEETWCRKEKKGSQSTINSGR